ncbi:uncharacterized protein LOC123682869 isoform X1 [Harmonia axyridis]|uniref:uncharacterized protein LOC123682869 isoform X1 n=2 Tax=Harmonia axyridis TaxID=115357 RepID=UPI001E274F9D|nr:uncharacterized protein LOC123682869 isoform X1 [Harmonia axyridis]XP_045477629.1 uncharacterized protein LOC123682869 isoform X1 [Harmonia axyridis]
MGIRASSNVTSSGIGDDNMKSKVWLYLYRTWEVLSSSERWTKSRTTSRSRNSDLSEVTTEYGSQFSVCSCSQCQKDDGFSSGDYSDLFDSVSTMAPNSEDSARIDRYNLVEENNVKEKQRPPIYNPEDYALSLKKWGKKSMNGCGVSLYSNPASADPDGTRTVGHSFRDYRNPMLISSGSEMTLRQFGTVSELLNKLKSDLRLAYPSFTQEFVSEPLDGINLLLDLLRAVQLSQSTNPQAFSGSNHTTGKVPPTIQRRALLDELSCLQCLSSCCNRYSDATRRLTSSSAGLFTLAICIMSNVNKSRILALQLLAKVCEESFNGHSAVSEALSTLRLRFGEPVRFRFLVGILNSTGAQGELLVAGMKFINSFLASAPSSQKRLYIQAELDQAGFDLASMKKNIVGNSDITDKIFEELQHWERTFIDVETLTIRAESAEKENDSLRDKILLLERRIQILQEEKTILTSLEKCLKDRCKELQSEMNTFRSNENLHKDFFNHKGDLSKTDDEGISSSERSSSPEGDTIDQKQASYDLYRTQCCTLQYNFPKKKEEETKPSYDEEETTIEEVMEEFQNIINDAESQNCLKEQKSKEHKRKKIQEAQVAGKIQLEINPPTLDDFSILDESKDHKGDQARKTKSLVHLYLPSNEEYEYENINKKGLFFGNVYTSDDDTNSSLSNYRWRISNIDRPQPVLFPDDKKPDTEAENVYMNSSYQQPKMKRTDSSSSLKRGNSSRRLPNFDFSSDITSAGTHVTVSCQKNNFNYDDFENHRIKSKSLDRIDDGLETMVDIVVADPRTAKYTASRTKSDSGNATSISRSISHVFINPPKQFRSRVNSYSEEKQKMFLPTLKDQFEVPYYFPRVQEKLSSTSSAFLINRGHNNAGLYSGRVYNSNISRKESRSTRDSLPIFTSISKSSSGRVTDLPSGLY